MELDRWLGRLARRPGGRATKFITYFELREACAQPGCPVCARLRVEAKRSFEALLYEQVTDPATRRLLAASGGFCAWHAGMGREVESAASGIAMIYEELLARAREELDAVQRELPGRPAVRGWRRVIGRARPPAWTAGGAARPPCPLCIELGRSEADCLEVLLEHLDDGEFERVYARAAGICLPHLLLAMRYFPDHRNARLLLARAVAKLDALASDLREFIAKHDYRRRAPFTEGEATSWTRAVEFLAGRPELFGPQIPRPVPGTSAARDAGAGSSRGPSGAASREPGRRGATPHRSREDEAAP